MNNQEVGQTSSNYEFRLLSVPIDLDMDVVAHSTLLQLMTVFEEDWDICKIGISKSSKQSITLETLTKLKQMK